MNKLQHSLQKGFTLVEMIVIAPIVILMIGAFIALIVNLTGEVMSSRGSNVITYDLQDTLNRIEEDVKLSTTYLAVNNISVANTKQGYGNNTSTGSTVNFTNIAKTGGSNASLILNGLVTNGNPMSSATNLVYLANKPNLCNSLAEYSQNTPMTMNIVYFVDTNNTLWRRTIMPENYATASVRCGAAMPWQQPSCLVGYNTTTMPFCRTNDVKLTDGVTPENFTIQYFPSADSTVADPTAGNASITNDAVRGSALQATPTIDVSITVNKTIAGREVSRTGNLRVTRLDTNASSIAVEQAPTAAPAAPVVSSTVSDGHNVNFTWPRVAGAASYDLEYRINSGSWVAPSEATNVDNNNRAYTVSAGNHQDTVEARVRATNSFGDSTWGSNSIVIPLWAPLILKGGWTDYAQGYTTAAYTRTNAGVIVLKGLVRNSGTVSSGSVIGTLPQDYIPERNIMYANSSNQVVGRLDIQPDGDVSMAVGSPAWFSLDGVTFMPEGTPYTNLALQNGWTNWDNNWNQFSYYVDSVGRTHLRGLARGGTLTAGTAITTAPAAIRLTQESHWPQIVNNGLGHIGMNTSTGALMAKNGASAQFNSLSALYYPSAARASGTSCTTQWCNLSLQNGWVHYAAAYSSPQYTKGSDGIVSLKGLIRAGTASTMATLPAGFCPKQRLLTTVVTADVWGRVDVIPQSDGTCLVQGSSYNNTWVSLDSLRFVAEP